MSRVALIADDDGLSREYLAEALRTSGYTVIEATTGRAALSRFESCDVDIVFSDLRMPDGDGLHVLAGVKSARPEVPVVLVTAYGSVETAVRALQDGAEDFVVKPVTVEQIDVVLQRIAERESLRRENRVLKACIDGSVDTNACIGESEIWRRCVSLARRVSKTRATVLVRGESGSGKEVVATLLHRESVRRGGPFIKTNCAVLQASLLSSELFGHEKGAFTGAYARKEGRFELADGGTLFLDEVGEITPEIQAKLLRVLETGEFERVGGKETLKVDVRVVCATNRDLETMIERGEFREDLFYRLNVVPVEVPALRERGDDILLLARHFVERYQREYGGPGTKLSRGAERTLLAYEWPGNVRELANVIQRVVLLAGEETIKADQLGLTTSPRATAPGGMIGQTIAEMERRLILGTLEATCGNKTEASKILGVTARTLSNKMKLYRERGLLPTAVGEPQKEDAPWI